MTPDKEENKAETTKGTRRPIESAKYPNVRDPMFDEMVEANGMNANWVLSIENVASSELSWYTIISRSAHTAK